MKDTIIHQLGSEYDPPLASELLKKLELSSLMTAMELPRQECTIEWYVWKQKTIINLMEEELKQLKEVRDYNNSSEGKKHPFQYGK